MQQRSWLQRLVPYAYLSPALLSITVLTLVPVIYTVYVAFTDYSLFNMRKYGIIPPGSAFIGLDNFKELIVGPLAKVFFPVMTWTFVWATLATMTCFVLGMFIAVLLNNPFMPESNLYRALFIIPWALPGTIAILAWNGLLNMSAGSINLWLGRLFGADPIPWLMDPTWARVSVLLVNLWMGFPWFMTICLGALQSIPYEVYEAADIDGASSWQKFQRVTFPMLWRFSVPLLVGSFAFNFNNFGTAFLMTGGGPARLDTSWAGYTDLLASVGYKLTVSQLRYGLSSAVSIILFILVGGISLLNMKLTRAFGEDDAR